MSINKTFKQKYKMETRNISLTLEEAKEWYNSNIILRDVALKAFTKEELEPPSFKNIKTFQDACEVLNLDYTNTQFKVVAIAEISKASAAMFKLNIIRKAINLGQDLYLTKDPEDSYIYYPYNPLITEDSDYYKSELFSGQMEVIGKVRIEGTLYNVLGGDVAYGGDAGLGGFSSYYGVGVADANIGFLGCASKKIAQHLGKYFGMLITEAKYGDMVDFEIISNIY